MLSIATLKAKLIIAGILLAIAGAGGFYVWSLNKRIDSLKEDKIELSSQLKDAENTIQENQRLDDIVDEVNNLGNEERVIINRVYETKIKEIDKNVSEGKDKPIGELLTDFFNNGLYNEN